MSFMFNPFPFDDPAAVNNIDCGGMDLSGLLTGNEDICRVLNALGGRRVIGVDGYPTAPFERLAAMFGDVELIPVSSAFKTAEDIDRMVAPCLPENREIDPVLLYGKMFDGGYAAFFDGEKLAALRKRLNTCEKTVVLYGCGSLSDSVRDLCDVKIFCDITQKRAVLNVKNGQYTNLGTDTAIPFNMTMRRCYYVDFELAFQLRGHLLGERLMDYYIAGDNPGEMKIVTGEALIGLLDRALDYPLRCRPVYLEGVWGGYSVINRRRLPETMKNCAWIFDLIPMEVSLALRMDGKELEVPFYAAVHAHGEKLMGKRCVEQFRGYFPIRFNYDDTMHSSGNMSIQLHPGEKYVWEHYGDLGRQDESYYIVEAAQEAKTYLGFYDDTDVEKFLSEVKRSEREHTPVAYQEYVHGVDSVPGTQVMIPAGTIHASGRNQLILEIGSLTIGSYTYKMYDYVRTDLDGNPRPLHTFYGEENLNHNMRESYVRSHLVNGRKSILRRGDDWCELVVGECDQLYFSLRNLMMGDRAEDDTKGDFHVLALVNGEGAEVRSLSDPTLKFTMNYLDIIVVPASMGAYEIINQKPGTRLTLHKTLLKQDDLSKGAD